MNILLDAWATTMWRACWQGGLVVMLVWTICRLLPSNVNQAPVVQQR